MFTGEREAELEGATFFFVVVKTAEVQRCMQGFTSGKRVSVSEWGAHLHAEETKWVPESDEGSFCCLSQAHPGINSAVEY